MVTLITDRDEGIRYLSLVPAESYPMFSLAGLVRAFDQGISNLFIYRDEKADTDSYPQGILLMRLTANESFVDLLYAPKCLAHLMTEFDQYLKEHNIKMVRKVRFWTHIPEFWERRVKARTVMTLVEFNF
jgi:hypothetical protein